MAPTRFDLTALVERLRASQFRVETRQFLAAAELLVAYAEAGVDVASDRERLGRCLGPIFCSSPEEQAAFAEILDPPPSPPRQPPLDPPADPPFRAWHRARWAVPLGVAIVGVVALTVFYPTGPLPPEADRTAGKRQASGGVSGQPDAHPPSPGELQVPPSDQAPAPTSTGYRISLVATLEPPAPTVMSRRQIGWARSLEEALACAAAAFVLWWLVARVRGKLILWRLPVRDRPNFATLAGDEEERPPAVSERTLRRVASLLRRPRDHSELVIDIRQSVEAAARGRGLALPRYAARRAIPEYLVLMENLGPQDHQARLYDRTLDGLEQEGLAVTRYTFAGDPRTCFEAKAPHRPRLLSELLGRHHRARVIVFVEAGRCFNPLSGRLESWVDRLRPLTRPALMTPLPLRHWTRHEGQLAERGWLVLSAGPRAEGLTAYAQIEPEADAETPRPSSAPYARPYPALLITQPQLALDRETPSIATMNKLVRQLKGYLGPRGFGWLAACAVYPEIEWQLTLHLSKGVAGGTGADSDAELAVALAQLARLPWFRVGFMPEWLRLTLLAQLSWDQELAVRDCLARRLEDLARRALARRSGQAVSSGLQIGAWVAPMDLLRTSAPADPLRDAVFIGYMAGAALPAPALAAPPLLRRLFRRVGRLPPQETTVQASSRTLAQKLARRARAITAHLPTLGGVALSLLAGAFCFPALLNLHTSTITTAPPDGPLAFALTPAGDRLFTTRGGGAQLWNRNGKLLGQTTLPPSELLTFPVVTDDGHTMASLSRSGFAWVWSGDQLSLTLHAAAHAFAFSHDGSRIALADKNRIDMFELATRAKIATLSTDGEIGAIIFSPDGSRLLAISTAGKAQLWDLRRNVAVEEISALSPDEDPIGMPVADFSPDGTKIAIALANGRVGIGDLLRPQGVSPNTKSQAISEMETGSCSAVRAVKYGPGGVLTMLCGDGSVSFQMLVGWMPGFLSFKDAGRTALFFADGGKTVWRVLESARAGLPAQISVWDDLGPNQVVIPPGGINIRAAAFDRTGSTLAARTADAVLVYDVKAPPRPAAAVVEARPRKQAAGKRAATGSDRPPGASRSADLKIDNGNTASSSPYQLRTRARQALSRRECPLAVDLAKKAEQFLEPKELAEIEAVCACVTKDASSARTIYQGMKGSAFEVEVKYRCKENGIDLEEPVPQGQRPATDERKVAVPEADYSANGVRDAAERKQIGASVLRLLMQPAKKCYQRLLTNNSTAGGQLSVRLTVTTDGTVSGVAIEKDTIGDPRLAACVRSTVAELHLAPPSGGPVDIVIPLTFKGDPTESTDKADTKSLSPEELMTRARDALSRRECPLAADLAKKAESFTDPSEVTAIEVACACVMKDETSARNSLGGDPRSPSRSGHLHLQGERDRSGTARRPTFRKDARRQDHDEKEQARLRRAEGGRLSSCQPSPRSPPRAPFREGNKDAAPPKGNRSIDVTVAPSASGPMRSREMSRRADE